MRVASAVLNKDDYLKLESYEKLLREIEGRLILCKEQKIEVVVFPALFGCLFNSEDKYIDDIAELSYRYKGIAICPGSYYEKEHQETYHSSSIIMDGKILLRQRQIYLAKWEKNIGLSRGVKLDSLSILGIKLGIIVSTDVFYPQVSRAIAMKGVELVLSPVAVIGVKNTIRQFAGLWQNVQANLFFGIESGFTGNCNGYEFSSKSMIHAPLEATERKNGLVAFESKAQELKLISAELNNEKRKDAVKKFNPIAALNRNAYEGMFKVSEGGGGNE